MFKKNVLKEEIYRVFTERSFWLAFLISHIFCAIGLSNYIKDMGITPQLNSAYEAWFYAHGRGSTAIFSLLVPLVVSLPFSDSYLVDKKSGYINFILTRSSKRAYLMAKFLANSIAGGIVASIPLITTLLITMLFLPRKILPEGQATFIPEGAFSSIYCVSPLSYILILCGLAFFFGVVYATLGLSISMFARNRYIVLAIPFLLYNIANFVLAILSLAEFTPPTTIAPYGVTNTTPVTVLGELFMIFTVSLLLIYMSYKRKLNEV